MSKARTDDLSTAGRAGRPSRPWPVHEGVHEVPLRLLSAKEGAGQVGIKCPSGERQGGQGQEGKGRDASGGRVQGPKGQFGYPQERGRKTGKQVGGTTERRRRG